MKRILVVAVGRLKTSWCKEAAAHYQKLLSRHFRLDFAELKDSPAALPAEERVRIEGEAILGKLPERCAAVCLDERGETMTSVRFADFLRAIVEGGEEPVFILGGPYGLAQPVRDRARSMLALGPMTLPHELARVVLCEQLWRAVSIWRNIPYHNV